MLSSNTNNRKRITNKSSLMRVFFVLILFRIMLQVPWGKNAHSRGNDFCFFTFRCVSSSEVRIVDKITDLPMNYSKYLTNRRPESVQSRSVPSPTLYDQHPSQFSQPEPLQQYRSPTYNYPSSFLFSLSNHFSPFEYCIFRRLYNNIPLIVYQSKCQSTWLWSTGWWWRYG